MNIKPDLCKGIVISDRQVVAVGSIPYYQMWLNAPEIAAKAKPGQFVMLRVWDGLDPLLSRPFSISEVRDNNISILYRMVGKGTRLIRDNTFNKGLGGAAYPFRLLGPLGNSFDLSCSHPVLMAGGIGIAPLLFAAARLSEEGKEPYFYWGVLQLDSAPQYDFFPVAVAHSIKIIVEHGPFYPKGIVTDFLNELPDEIDAILACGPLGMLKVISRWAFMHNIPCQVSLEAPMACGLGVCQGCVLPRAGGGYFRVCREGPVVDAAVVDWDRL